MSCAKYLPLISRFLDGEVTAAERAEMEDHLASCASCRVAHDDWRAHGLVLRGYFARNRLDESFVQKVRSASAAGRPESSRRWHFRPAKGVVRWAQAIAALVVIGFLVAQFFPALERSGLAKVINPGDGLQVCSPGAGNWTRTAAGAVLKAGDWIRNAERSAAQILLLDATRVTLNGGAVAQIGSGSGSSDARLTLLQGTVSSDEASGRALEVRAAAGAVVASRAQFDVHVEDIVVPKLVMSDDAAEVLTGSALPVAGVMVTNGKVQVAHPSASREIGSGQTAYFTPAQLSVVSGNPPPAHVVATLRAESTSATTSGTLGGDVVSTDGGLQIQVRAQNLPLRRLLQSITGERVAGTADVRVTGGLAYPVETTDAALVEAIGNQLGVTISVSEQGFEKKLASISERKVRLVSELQPRSDFTVRKSPDGLVSFDFRGVPAGRVFQALQSVSVDLPELSSQDRWIPITLEAAGLSPGEVAPLVEKELGLVMTGTGTGVRVVQVGGQSAPAAAQPGALVAFTPATLPSLAAGDTAVTTAPGESNAAELTRHAPSAWWPVARVANMMPISSVAGLPGPTATTRRTASGASSSTSSSTATGKISTRDRYTGSRHLVWPPVLSGGSVYIISNPWVTRGVETVWKGYDASGQLISVQEMRLDPSSSITVSPLDLPALGDNGHWETISDYQVFSFTETTAAVPAVEVENVPDKWEFDLAQLGTGERLWFANPVDSDTRLVLAVVRGDEVIASQQIVLGPHMALTWAADAQASGAVLVANVAEGSLAAGVVPAADQAGWQRGRRGQWVQ